MLDTDNPSDREDVYHRGTLAERIAHILAKPLSKQSLVVALEGPWGSGKSWLIEKSVEQLKEQGSTVIQFNPWLIGEESDLILDFLIQMALEIRPIETTVISAIDSSKSASRTLIKYARALSYGRYLKYAPIPVAKEIGEWIDDHADQINQKLDTVDETLKSEKRAPSLSEARAAARDAISHMGGRLIVVIDDIDRLRPKEIRAIMQVVKSVLDFPNTTFLLSYDLEQVAESLSDTHASALGHQYLEKIVQLSISIPPLEDRLLFNEVQNQFERVRQHLHYELRPWEAPLIQRALQLVAKACEIPRDVIRWANRLHWSMDGLQGSVNAADLCAIELLQLKLDKNPLKTLQEGSPSAYSRSSDRKIYATLNKNTDKDSTKDLFDEITNINQREILEFITGWGHNPRAQAKRRLASPAIWHHYIRFSTGLPILSGRDAESIINDNGKLDEIIFNLKSPDEHVRVAAMDTVSELAGFIDETNIPSDAITIDKFIQIINAGQNIQQNSIRWRSEIYDMAGMLFLQNVDSSSKEELLLHLSPTASIAGIIRFRSQITSTRTKIDLLTEFDGKIDSIMVEVLNNYFKHIKETEANIFLLNFYSAASDKIKSSTILMKLLNDNDKRHILLNELSDQRNWRPLIEIMNNIESIVCFFENLNNPELNDFISACHREIRGQPTSQA